MPAQIYSVEYTYNEVARFSPLTSHLLRPTSDFLHLTSYLLAMRQVARPDEEAAGVFRQLSHSATGYATLGR